MVHPIVLLKKTELQLLRKRNPSILYQLSVKPPQLRNYDYWQYGNGSHASSRRIILWSALLYARKDNENLTSICHLVLEV